MFNSIAAINVPSITTSRPFRRAIALTSTVPPVTANNKVAAPVMAPAMNSRLMLRGERVAADFTAMGLPVRSLTAVV
jgi:hypothetical protein